MPLSARTKAVAGSAAVIGAAVALTAGTFSYFTDSGTSPTQSIATGTLRLAVGGSAQADPFRETDIAPGTPKVSRKLTVVNDGSLPGTLTLRLVKDSDAENGCGSALELVADATCAVPDSPGELGGALIVGAVDTAGTARWAGRGATVNDWNASAGAAQPAQLGTLAAGDSVTLRISAGVDAGTGNAIQSDSTSFHLVLDLDQVR